MTEKPSHPIAVSLFDVWKHLYGGKPAASGRPDELGLMLSATLKDSFIARGPAEGPFEFTFVGTDLQDVIGRDVPDLAEALDLDRQDATRLYLAIAEMHGANRPLLVNLRFASPKIPTELAGELLCLPIGSVGPAPQSLVIGKSRTFVGALGIIGRSSLADIASHRKIRIESLSLL